LKTDFGGLPIAFHLTGGEASDSRNFQTLLDIGPDIATIDTAPAAGTAAVTATGRDVASAHPFLPAPLHEIKYGGYREHKHVDQ
jgi:hypothetical protein